MLALSVQQPWPWLIFHGGKDVENRTWEPSTTVMGRRIAIHASKGGPKLDPLDVLQDMFRLGVTQTWGAQIPSNVVLRRFGSNASGNRTRASCRRCEATGRCCEATSRRRLQRRDDPRGDAPQAQVAADRDGIRELDGVRQNPAHRAHEPWGLAAVTCLSLPGPGDLDEPNRADQDASRQVVVGPMAALFPTPENP